MTRRGPGTDRAEERPPQARAAPAGGARTGPPSAPRDRGQREDVGGPPHRVFLLSPASCGGKRAGLLLRNAAAFPLALRVRDGGAPLHEVFTFLSGLYFRGKIAYARAFAAPPPGAPAVLVITTSRGLVSPDAITTLADLEEYARVPIGADSAGFVGALARTARELYDRITVDTRVVLLGSIATGKYVDILVDVFGDRLRFPAEFVGRGDMSRGGLMLRCAEDRTELEYVAIDGRARRGRRPPRLTPRRYPRAAT